MQILEQQALYLYDLLSCRIQMPRARLPEMLPRIPEQLGTLGLQQNGRILFTEDPAQERNIEILIPVRGEFASCAQYEKKPVFKLINAVSARHAGSFSALAKTEQQLFEKIDRALANADMGLYKDSEEFEKELLEEFGA